MRHHDCQMDLLGRWTSSKEFHPNPLVPVLYGSIERQYIQTPRGKSVFDKREADENRLRTYRHELQKRAAGRGDGNIYTARVSHLPRLAPATPTKGSLPRRPPLTPRSARSLHTAERSDCRAAGVTACVGLWSGLARSGDAMLHSKHGFQLRVKPMRNAEPSLGDFEEFPMMAPSTHGFQLRTKRTTSAESSLGDFDECPMICNLHDVTRMSILETEWQMDPSHALQAEEARFSNAARSWCSLVRARFDSSSADGDVASMVRACAKWLAINCNTQRGAFHSLSDLEVVCVNLGMDHTDASHIAATLWEQLHEDRVVPVVSLLQLLEGEAARQF